MTGHHSHTRLFATAAAIAFTCAGGAAAQVTQPQVSEVVVTGQVLANQRAIATKRDDTRISDTLAANDIGSLPDFGLGQALSRVPGLTLLENGQRGEAQFVSIRGVNSEHTLITVDGVALPATESTRRNVSLDVLPSGLADSVSVFKSLTPGMDANAIGGQITSTPAARFRPPAPSVR